MKKKISKREEREQRKAQAFALRKAQDKAKAASDQKTQEAKEKETDQKAIHAMQLNGRLETGIASAKKSAAKAAGLKSAFVLNSNELLLTSFGNGNAAVPEKHIVDLTVEDINIKKPAFAATAETAVIGIHSHIDASIDNPLHRALETETRRDLIGCADQLEQRFFGSTFSDNIHIQLIYNILDIEKLLTVHINHIIYVLNNLIRSDTALDDLVGSLGSRTQSLEDIMSPDPTKQNKVHLKENFVKLCNGNRLSYFGIEVEHIPTLDTEANGKGKATRKKPDPNALHLSAEEFFHLLQVIGCARQALAHGSQKDIQYLYDINAQSNVEGALHILSKLYEDSILRLNSHFIDKSAKDFVILFNAFGAHTKEEKRSYVKEYYDFVVKKEYKNLGFSIKLLRECLQARCETCKALKDERYDSVRQKLNRFFDFTIYQHYKSHPAQHEILVGGLRASSGTEEKNRIYMEETRKLWPEIEDRVLKHILPHISGDSISKIKPDSDVTQDMLKDVLISANATWFTKIMYLMTLFLDGKEINTLLTTLINKFENIASFLAVLHDRRMNAEFKPPYTLFANSAAVAKELRTLNSIARMRRESVSAKKTMFVEAAQLLGYKKTDDELNKYLDDDMLSKTNEAGKKKEMGFRNFIAKNVIGSSRFKYLVRYGHPGKIRHLAQNRQVVVFVLKGIPDSQIIRYYTSCISPAVAEDPQIMRSALADRLTGLSFEEFASVKQNDRFATPEEKQDKVRKQASIRLYLTVLYLLVKNLVYVNARYFMAFHCVERDRLLYDPDKWSKINENNNKFKPEYAWPVFAKDRLDAQFEALGEPPVPPAQQGTCRSPAVKEYLRQRKKYYQKNRVLEYLQQDFRNTDDWATRTFRNKVEHLDAVRNADQYIDDIRSFTSYYGLYHYLLQRCIGEKVNNNSINPIMAEYFNFVKNKGEYKKHMVKALCVPFSYNLPRYKNLSTEELFDQNDPLPKKKGTASTRAESDSLHTAKSAGQSNER